MTGTVTVNDEEVAWHEGMTVSDVLQARQYVFPLLVVHVDGRLIKRNRYGETEVPEGATVTVVHLMSGG